MSEKEDESGEIQKEAVEKKGAEEEGSGDINFQNFDQANSQDEHQEEGKAQNNLQEYQNTEEKQKQEVVERQENEKVNSGEQAILKQQERPLQKENLKIEPEFENQNSEVKNKKEQSNQKQVDDRKVEDQAVVATRGQQGTSQFPLKESQIGNQDIQKVVLGAQSLPEGKEGEEGVIEKVDVEKSQGVVPLMIPSSVLIREAESERVGSIYQHFTIYNSNYHQVTSNYKCVIKSVCSQLESRVEYKKNLQNLLIDYFQDYSKIHRHFHDKSAKIPKEDQGTSVNKFVNIKQQLRRGFSQLHFLRRNIGIDAHKLDSYICNYIIKNIRQVFETNREESHSSFRSQISPKDQFLEEEKGFKKMASALEKMCKKGMTGEKYKDDIFVELASYVREEKKYRQALKIYGRTVLVLRKDYMDSEKKLFINLQKIMNEFKNEQKAVYTATSQFGFVENYVDFIERKNRFEDLCTITDSDFIKGVMQLHSRKQRVEFTNKHFEQFLDMPFFERTVGQSDSLLKTAFTKTFPMKNDSFELIHTISQNLVVFDKLKSECVQRFDIKALNAKIFAQGAVEFEVVTGLIFKDTKVTKVQLKDDDRAQELISYLNQMQQIKAESLKK